MKKTMYSALLAVVTLSAEAANTSPYIGAGAVVARHDYSVLTRGSDKTDTTVGKKIFLGYQIDPHWAVEGGFADFGNSKCQCNFMGAATHVTARAKAWYVAGKGSYLLSEQLSLTGKLGLSLNNNDASNAQEGVWYRDRNRKGLYAALGLDYALSPSVTASLALERYGSSKPADVGLEPTTLSLGVQFGF